MAKVSGGPVGGQSSLSWRRQRRDGVCTETDCHLGSGDISRRGEFVWNGLGSRGSVEGRGSGGLKGPAGRLIKTVSGSRQASCVCGPPSHLGPMRRWPTLSFKLTVTASKFLLVFE